MKAETENNLLLTTVYLSRLLTKHAKKRGIRTTAFSVLNNLEHWGALNESGTLTQKELADMEDVTPATMSTLIRDLKSEKLLYTSTSKADGRSVNVGLTKKGSKYLAVEGQKMRALMGSLLDELSEAELASIWEGQQILAKLCLSSSSIQAKMSEPT